MSGHTAETTSNDVTGGRVYTRINACITVLVREPVPLPSQTVGEKVSFTIGLPSGLSLVKARNFCIRLRAFSSWADLPFHAGRFAPAEIRPGVG